MAVEESKKEFYFDTRLSQRHIRKGHLDRKDYQDYLDALPDLAESSEDIGELIFGAERARETNPKEA